MSAIGILGAGGRMGQTLVRLIAESSTHSLAAAVVHPDSALLGSDAGVMVGHDPIGVKLTHDTAQAAAMADVLIDFTLPDALEANIEAAVTAQTPLVVGTTGIGSVGLAALDQASQHIALVYAANYSSGVTLMLRLTRLAAAALDVDYDVEVLEAHHRFKRDAPSGTAKALGEQIASAREVDLATHAVYAREGITGERGPGDIGFQTLRGGDIVGEHTVMFAGEGERIELTHRASSRETFARGALRAAQWVIDQPVGRYDMEDVLGLRA